MMCIYSLSYSPIQRGKTYALILARTIITSYSDKDNDKIRSFSFMGKDKVTVHTASRALLHGFRSIK